MKAKMKAKPGPKPRIVRHVQATISEFDEAMRAADEISAKMKASYAAEAADKASDSVGASPTMQGEPIGYNPYYQPQIRKGVFVGGSMDGRRLESSEYSVTISNSGDALRPDVYSFVPLLAPDFGMWLISGATPGAALARVIDAYSRAAGASGLNLR